MRSGEDLARDRIVEDAPEVEILRPGDEGWGNPLGGVWSQRGSVPARRK